MSIRCVSWALNEAPVDEPVQVLVLVAMAERANDDGTVSYQSKATIAHKARISVRTCHRVMGQLETLGVIRRGDQRHVEHLPLNRRPVVYDLVVTSRRGDNLAPLPPVTPQEKESGVTNEGVRGDIDDSLGVTRMADNTSSESSLNNSSLVGEPKARRRWHPGERAWHTATTEICSHLDHEDLGLITARYELICHEKKKKPDPAEWLRWVIEDEKKAKAAAIEKRRANAKKEPWHAVAE